MLTPNQLETYMRRAAALTHDTIEQPPFVLFFNAADPLRFFNYARPTAPLAGDLRAPLVELCAAFRARERLPRFEFLWEFAPDFGAALLAAGYQEEGHNPLLVCTRETLRPAPAVPGLEIVPLTPDSPSSDLRAAVTVQRRAFGDGNEPEATDADAADQQKRVAAGAGGFIGRLNGEVVAVADYTVPLDGFTELVGIATTAGYRGRGIATALTAAASEAAFAQGVDVVFLGAEDERAGRVYERVGFKPFGTLLAYALEA
jgi:ribosomal protein S18 acetylase RimI-like enzyme